jgi:hypothetical protein
MTLALASTTITIALALALLVIFALALTPYLVRWFIVDVDDGSHTWAYKWASADETETVTVTESIRETNLRLSLEAVANVYPDREVGYSVCETCLVATDATSAIVWPIDGLGRIDPDDAMHSRWG